jgi:hypothetical protein
VLGQTNLAEQGARGLGLAYGQDATVRGLVPLEVCPGADLRSPERKPNRGTQLVARLDYFQHDQKGPITQAQFLALAWKLANDKAREQGWIK